MATLTNTTIAATYTLLLKIDSSGVDSTLRKVEDGDATDSALSIATTSIAIDATDKFGFDGTDTGTYITEASDGVLDFYADAVQMLSLVEGGTDYVWVPVDATKMALGAGKDLQLYTSSDDSYIENITSDKDIILRVNDGGSNSNMVTLDASDQRVLVASSVASASDTGAHLRLYANDGALMGDGHRLGVIEFAGAEDSSNNITVGARIEAVTDAAWSASENGADMVFYTTDGNASQSEVMRLTADAGTLFSKAVTTGVDATGVDIRAYSNTTNEGLFYDASEDEFGLLLTTKLKFHDIGGGEEIYASADGHLEINSATTLDITAPTVDINASTKVNIDGALVATTAFTGTTTATTKAAHIDFDATGITASGQTATNIGLDLDMNSNAPTMVGTVNNTGIDLDMVAATSGVQTNTGVNIAVSGADTNYALVTSGGNVGIGTSTPEALLEIEHATGDANIYLSTTNSTITDGNTLGNIYAFGLDAAKAMGALIRFQAAGTWDTGTDTHKAPTEIQIYTQDDSTSDTMSSPVMVINSVGNVGVGDSDPSEAKLSITGVASGDAGIKVNQVNASVGIWIDHDANENALYIDHDGATSAECIKIVAPTQTTGEIISLNALDTLTTGAAIQVDAGGTSLATTIGGGLVEVLYDGAGTSVNNLLYIKNNSTTAAATVGLFVEQKANARSISIDSDASSYEVIKISSPSTTTGSVIGIDDANALTTGSILNLATSNTGLATTVSGGMVKIMHTGNSGAVVNNLLFVKNDTPASTGTIPIYVQQDSTAPAISATGGIVEQGGALKENLLSNSGFDVWSNSTLENVGSDLMGAMTDNGSYPWETRPGGNPNGAWANSTGWGLAYKAVSLTVGKLYRISFDGSSLSGVSTIIGTASDTAATNFANKVAITATSSITSVFEATATTTHIVMQTESGSASGFTLANFTLYEVTPACVAADNKAFDGWIRDRDSGNYPDIYRQHNDGGTLTHDGSFYSLKVVKDNSAREYIYGWKGYTLDEVSQRFAGRTVTFGCWVKSITATDNFRLGIYDGSMNVGDLVDTADSWVWVEYTHSVSASATGFTPALIFDGDASDVAYISQPMLVFGSSIGEGNYTRPRGETVWFEKAVEAHLYDGTTQSDIGTWTTLNLETDTLGAVPKGAKAVYVRSDCKDSGSAGTDCYFQMRADASGSGMYINSPAGLANDKSNRVLGWQPCDVNGDVQVYLEASGSSTFDIDDISIHGVQLR